MNVNIDDLDKVIASCRAAIYNPCSPVLTWSVVPTDPEPPRKKPRVEDCLPAEDLRCSTSGGVCGHLSPSLSTQLASREVNQGVQSQPTSHSSSSWEEQPPALAQQPHEMKQTSPRPSSPTYEGVKPKWPTPSSSSSTHDRDMVTPKWSIKPIPRIVRPPKAATWYTPSPHRLKTATQQQMASGMHTGSALVMVPPPPPPKYPHRLAGYFDHKFSKSDSLACARQSCSPRVMKPPPPPPAPNVMSPPKAVNVYLPQQVVMQWTRPHANGHR